MSVAEQWQETAACQRYKDGALMMKANVTLNLATYGSATANDLSLSRSP